MSNESLNGRNGLLKVTVFSAKNLYHASLLTKEDPYVIAKVGGATDQTTPHIGGGVNPVWNYDLEINLQHPSINIVKGKLEIEIWDKNYVKDSLMGTVSIPLWDLLKSIEPVMHWYPAMKIRGKKTVHGGEILIQTEYLEPLVLHVHRARGLRSANWFAQQNPRCVVSVGPDTYKGVVKKNSAKDPQFRELFIINPSPRFNRSLPHPMENQFYREIPADKPKVPLYIQIKIETVNSITNKAIGYAQVPFYALVQNDGTPQWFTVGSTDKVKDNAGEVLVSLHPYGILEAMEREAELAEAAYNDNAAAVSYVDEEEARAYHAEQDEQDYNDQQEYDQYEKYHSEEYDGVEEHQWNDGEVIENDHQVQYEHEVDGISHTTPIYKEETKGQQGAVANEETEITAAVEQPVEIKDESNENTNSGDDVQLNRMSSAKRMHEMLESARQSRSDLQYEDYYDSEEEEEEEEEEEVVVEREDNAEHGNEQQEVPSPAPRRFTSGGNGGGSDLSVNVAFEPNVDEEYDTATDPMSGTSHSVDHKVSDYTTSAPQSPTSWDEGHGGVDTAIPAHRMYAPPATRHQLY